LLSPAGESWQPGEVEMNAKIKLASRLVTLLMAMTLVMAGAPSLAKNHYEQNEPEHTEHSTERDRLDLEDQDKGYTTEYFFSLSRGIMKSTMDPALKPAVLILTVPLDLAFLPFAAIGGFLR
jgi:hypothetical protein